MPFLNKLENPNNKPPKIAINPNNSLTVLPIHTPVTRIIKAKNGLKITFTVRLISSLPEKILLITILSENGLKKCCISYTSVVYIMSLSGTHTKNESLVNKGSFAFLFYRLCSFLYIVDLPTFSPVCKYQFLHEKKPFYAYADELKISINIQNMLHWQSLLQISTYLKATSLSYDKNEVALFYF